MTLQEESTEEEGVSLSVDGQILMKDGVQYSVGDQVYVHPDTFDQLEQTAQAEVPDYAAKGRFHKVYLLCPPCFQTPSSYLSSLCHCIWSAWVRVISA